MHAPQNAAPDRLARPSTSLPTRILWDYGLSLLAVHLLAFLAVYSWFFSWTGVVLCIGGLYAFGTLGINFGYHRLLTHRGLKVPRWLEYTLSMLGVCCLQDTPARWAAIHRMHHQHTDEEDDPHSPLVGFFWGHVNWLFIENRTHQGVLRYERYARDLLKDPLYFRLQRGLTWLWVYLAHAALFFIVGFGAGWAMTGNAWAGFQFGSSVLIWGVFLRTVLVWHITWAVNSASHLWGYRSYATKDSSRNNWIVALLSNGEGWHNNHHWDQRSAAHGHRWWELDVTYWTIRAFEIVGLATAVRRPRANLGSPTDPDAEIQNAASEAVEIGASPPRVSDNFPPVLNRRPQLAASIGSLDCQPRLPASIASLDHQPRPADSRERRLPLDFEHERVLARPRLR